MRIKRPPFGSRGRTAHAVILGFALCGCAHQPTGAWVDRTPAVELEELVARFGYPRCHVSIPLTEDQALALEESDGAPDIQTWDEWRAMIDAMQAGDELRSLACYPRQGRGGVAPIGVFRDGRLVAELHTVIID